MLNDKSNNVTKITEDAGYGTSLYVGTAIGKDAGYTISKTYVCRNKNCRYGYVMFFLDSENKICEECGEAVERLTEKHLEPRPGELEALRKKYGIENMGGKDGR